jgi:hypothetical protein
VLRGIANGYVIVDYGDHGNLGNSESCWRGITHRGANR